jgi:hypothetical protein
MSERGALYSSGDDGFSLTKPLLGFAQPMLEAATRITAAVTPDKIPILGQQMRNIDFGLGIVNALGDEVIHFSSPMGIGIIGGIVGLGMITGPSLKSAEAAVKAGEKVAKIGAFKQWLKFTQGGLESAFSAGMILSLKDDFPELYRAGKRLWIPVSISIMGVPLAR